MFGTCLSQPAIAFVPRMFGERGPLRYSTRGAVCRWEKLSRPRQVCFTDREWLTAAPHCEQQEARDSGREVVVLMHG